MDLYLAPLYMFYDTKYNDNDYFFIFYAAGPIVI